VTAEFFNFALIHHQVRMKKVILTTGLLLGVWAQSLAQCGSKGMKAIDAKDYATAWAAFEECLRDDPDDLSANFGMSRLYGLDPARKDMKKALEHLVITETGWAKLDARGQAKFERLGVTATELASRRSRIETSFLEAAKAANTVEAYDNFLLSFPNSTSTTICTNLRNKRAYELALEDGSVAAIDQYLVTYPDAENAKDVARERDKRATAEALQANTEEALGNFLLRYPNALQAPQIQQRLNAVAFENAKTTHTVEAYQQYIARFPDSVFLTQARERLEWLLTQEQK
jgi:hypothetical protein